MDLLFRQARTYSGWLDQPLPDDLLRQLYDLAFNLDRTLGLNV